ncbi:hypothetical protein Ahy_B08g093976 [Arachis hypogaea]|uniref:Protein FAR1-RELATED SEQUENCE n=1 Tax=Arachis hypogaea TaxID=3818 RepID=A0A444Y7H9_ARAHY|nr:hypothetical protein Ahy_B08g093976 [Arachis hypogaea]
MTIILFIILDINMAFAIDLNTQSSSEEIHSFDTHIDMDDINICNSSSNSAIETECTTEVIIYPTIYDEEIPKVGMLFGTIEEARQFYYNYANKVGFEPHIRNTNFDKNGKTPINQSIQCNRDGYRTKKNPIPSNVELAHTHRCDPILSWMFKKNRELTMHVKDVIERNDQAGIRPSKTFQALADEAESFESSWYDFIEEYTLHDNNWLNGMNTHPKLDWVDKVNSSYILSRWSKNVYRKHTHIRSSHDSRRSDESMNIFRGLCVDFYNVAQDFVHDKEEADILRSAFASAKVALTEHRAKHSESVCTSECPDRLNALWSPPHVVPRGAQASRDSRRMWTGKLRMDFAPIEEDCFTHNTFSCIPEHFHHAKNTQMDSLSSGGFTTLLNSFQNPSIHAHSYRNID